MQIKRFEAKNMTTALRMIKGELGPEAVILSAKSLRKGKGFFGSMKYAGVQVTAAIDTSDGLSSDIQHIAEESGVGARLFADRIPISEPLSIFCHDIESDPLEWALAGGEDYTLLCTVSPKQFESVRLGYEEKFSSPLYRIGEIIEEQKMELVLAPGEVRPFEALGWNHFR